MMRLLLVFAAAVPAFGQCYYLLTPAATQLLNIPAPTYTATIQVDTPVECPWDFRTNVSWITFSNGPQNNQGTGPGSFTWTADANNFPSQRQGVVIVDGFGTSFTALQVTQAAPSCKLSLATASGNFGVAGGSGSFDIQTNCAWSATTSALWIAPTPTSGSTAASVNFTIAPNSCVAARTGTVTIFSFDTTVASAPFQISQDGSPGNLTLSPSSLSPPATATTGGVTVTTGSGCAWSVFSDVSWLHVTSGASGTGNGGFGYSIDANPGPARTGNLHLGTLLLPVAQQGAPPPSIQLTLGVNAASYAQGAVSPGEIVALGGSNMGPAQGVGAQLTPDKKFLTTTLGGVQALFDGVPAALTYASAAQVNAVVPYGVAGKPNTQVQVQYQGGQSNTLTLAVQDAAPGIFTLDASGVGPGAILNQDYTLNGRFRPAARGAAIQIFCTGGGVTSPASADGSITGTSEPFPRLVTQPVTVTIGGVPAQVLYSGGAPTSVAGLTQINAVVPLTVTPGASVPITVKVGNWQSQAGVTVAVQ